MPRGDPAIPHDRGLELVDHLLFRVPRRGLAANLLQLPDHFGLEGAHAAHCAHDAGDDTAGRSRAVSRSQRGGSGGSALGRLFCVADAQAVDEVDQLLLAVLRRCPLGP